jgi:DNA polymerase-3 subunit alpha
MPQTQWGYAGLFLMSQTNSIPLFKSQYSKGRSILTLEKPNSVLNNGPQSIIEIAKSNELKEIFLVDDSVSGFLQAYINCEEEKIKLNFGLRITVCSDLNEKNEGSLSKQSKYVIFVKNTEGYKRLIKIYSLAAKDGFYYEPRIDLESLSVFWDEKDLMLCVPFYDSYIHKNTLFYSTCIPSFGFCKPVFFIEDNNIPFDYILKKRVMEQTKGKYKVINAKSIYYKNKEDFKAYLTFRCINNRSTLNKPNLDHMCSNEFCFESWRKS